MGRKEAFLVTASVIVSLGLAEAAARLLLAPPLRVYRNLPPAAPRHIADPQIGWVLDDEDASYHHRMAAFDATYTIRDGHRPTSDQPVSGPVIVATGCSFTFGYGLDDAATWPWMLQQRLPAYHIVNDGVNGYGTDQALLAAGREIERSHDVRAVVLGFGDFQIDRNNSFQQIVQYPYPLSKPLFLPAGTGIAYAGQVKFWTPGAVLEHSALITHAVNRAANLYYRIPNHEQAFEITCRLIEEFSRRFRARNVPLMVVILPDKNDQARRSKTEISSIVSRLRQAGIPTLVPDFPRLPDGSIDPHKLLLHPDRHPNGEYNRLLSEQVAAFLRSEHVVP